MTEEHHHEHEENSIEEAGGCAAGFSGTIENFNTDAEMKLANALLTVGKYVQGESGCLLGHIKAAVYTDDGKGITLNLIDMDNGVEHHGTMARADKVKFNFMCAVLDVDEHELTHIMLHAIDDSGLDYAIDPESLHHHHHHHHDGDDDDDDDEEEEFELDEHGHHHHAHGGDHMHEEHHHHHHDDDDDDDDDDEEEEFELDEHGHHHHAHGGDHMHEEHHHHHDDDDDEHHENSMEEAGGVAVGLTGTIPKYTPDKEDKMAAVLTKVGKYVNDKAGCMLGHIKAAIYRDDGKGLTLNLIDLDNGVEHHGTLAACDNAKFNFMCAVLDVDEHDLQHAMVDAVNTSGLMAEIDPESLHHHHHHHHHDDDDDDECGCHHHHHDD